MLSGNMALASKRRERSLIRLTWSTKGVTTRSSFALLAGAVATCVL